MPILTHSSYLEKLMVLNNKILRIVQFKPLKTHVLNLYKNYNTLPVPKLHQFQLLCLIHTFFMITTTYRLPTVFSNYFTPNMDIYNKSRSRNNLHLSRVFTSRGARCLKFEASKLWNELPDRHKSITKLATFKKQLKALLTNDELGT